MANRAAPTKGAQTTSIKRISISSFEVQRCTSCHDTKCFVNARPTNMTATPKTNFSHGRRAPEVATLSEAPIEDHVPRAAAAAAPSQGSRRPGGRAEQLEEAIRIPEAER